MHTGPATTEPRPPGRAAPPRRRLVAIVVAAILLAGGLGAGLALASGGTPSSPASTAAATYSYYRSVIGRYGAGSMMGGSGYGWMAGPGGYGWMVGGTTAPGWMAGGNLPGFMMGTGTDPGSVMGSLFAGAPGPRVSPAEASRLGDRVPAGATVDRAGRRITFTGAAVAFTVLASPSMPAEDFRISGMTDPTVVVPAGARVTVRFINADSDMAHGLVVAPSGAPASWMPMMTSGPSFAGAAVWFLGESTAAGMHEATLRFTASQPGEYQYLCPVPGHAREGMAGAFVVR